MSNAIDFYEQQIADLRAEIDRVRLDGLRHMVKNSVHMQTMAILAKSHPEMLGDLIRKRVKFADEEALKARLEDCVIARPASRS